MPLSPGVRLGPYEILDAIGAGGMGEVYAKTLALPPRSPNLNAYAECRVRSVKEECLGKLILLSEGSLRRALRHYEVHYHEERITKAKTTCCYSLCRLKQSVENRKRCGVGSGLAAC